MRQKILIGLSLAALVVGGWGCVNKPQGEAVEDRKAMPIEIVEDGLNVDAPIPEDVDGAVEEIISTVDAEISADDIESDVAEITADDSDAAVIYESEYETE